MTAIPLKLGTQWWCRCNPCGWERAASGPRLATKYANEHNDRAHKEKK